MRLKPLNQCEKCGERASIKGFRGDYVVYEIVCRKCGGKNVKKFE